MDTPTGSGGRLLAFGNQLIDVHFWLRGELARLRADVESHLRGDAERPRDLRVHCVAFCSALERHHTGEDGGAFPVLAERFPELRPVLDELARDHHVVGDLLRGLRKLLDGLSGSEPAEARRVRAELDGLAALLESHFTYEERKIVAALNALNVPGWEDSPPDFLLTDSLRDRLRG
jgi:hemerythrin-like domain-containing protein